MPSRLFRLIVAAFATAGPACAGEPERATWERVAAVFAERCVMCHSDKGASRGLRLDSYEAVMDGGERGAVVVAGSSDESELVRRIRGESTPRMPFLGPPLPEEELDLIVRWVDSGVPMD